MGSPEFAVPILRRLSADFQVVGVVTQPDRPAGRGQKVQVSAVKSEAISLNFPLIQPVRLSEPEAAKQLINWAPDAIVVAAFGQLLKPAVLELPRQGCINVHASLLPRWRGAAPIQAAIARGDAQTGVSIMKMDAGLDTGPVYAREPVDILPTDTGGELTRRLSALGADLLAQVLPSILDARLNATPQDPALATVAPRLSKSDGALDVVQDAVVLERQVRAYQPWPGAYLIWKDSPLKILKAHAMAGEGIAGSRVVVQGLPAVITARGVLVLDEVQPAGKRPMDGGAFLHGNTGWGK